MEQSLPGINTTACTVVKYAHCQLNQMKGIKHSLWLPNSVRYMMVGIHGKEESCLAAACRCFLLSFIQCLLCISVLGPVVELFP